MTDVNNNLYDEIIAHFGTAKLAAQYFKVSKSTMGNWKKAIPKNKVKQIKKALRVNVDSLFNIIFCT